MYNYQVNRFGDILFLGESLCGVSIFGVGGTLGLGDPAAGFGDAPPLGEEYPAEGFGDPPLGEPLGEGNPPVAVAPAGFGEPLGEPRGDCF